MHVVQTGTEPIKFISSTATDSSEQLLAVKYTRVQPQSPQFMRVYEGIDQSVNIMVTTVVVRAAPEPVITLYDFIMTTFVPQGNTPSPSNSPQPEEGDSPVVSAPDTSSTQKIKVLIKLAGVQGKRVFYLQQSQAHEMTSHHHQRRRSSCDFSYVDRRRVDCSALFDDASQVSTRLLVTDR